MAAKGKDTNSASPPAVATVPSSSGSAALDADLGDTPIPAAEVLIDLKESAKRRKSLKARTSPRKRTLNVTYSDSSPKKMLQRHSSSRRLDFSNDSSSFQNSVTESSDEEEGEGPSRKVVNALKRPKRATIAINTTPTITPGSQLTTPREPKFTVYHWRLKDMVTPSQPKTVHHDDQATLHVVSSRLRNLLKLPKAHKWCYYEWFYSDVDQPLLERENDFCRCLAEMFPELKTRYLTRVHWRQIRRLMGKPRRCSPTFFMEERVLMECRRNKVRKLQQQVHQGLITVDDFGQYKDLPNEIPALLVLGTQVTARLHSDRERESGFYTGKIEAVDFGSNKYWVTFDRPGVGKHLINDTEIKSADPPEVISISSLESSRSAQWPPQEQASSIPIPATPPGPHLSETQPSMHPMLSPGNQLDPFLSSSPARRKMLHNSSEIQALLRSTRDELPEEVGGFSVVFLKRVTQLSKLLQLKQQRLSKLGQYNTEVEKMQARQKALPIEFQHKYAKVIIDLDDINKELNMRLDSIKTHCDSLGCGAELGPSMDVHEHAQKITESSNGSLEGSGSEVKEVSVLSLIARLTGLLLQIEGLSESGNSLDLASLTTSLADIEARVQPQNRKCFQTHVESPITLIQSGMSPIGTLHAFSMGHAPRNNFPHH